jgi:hypothetical protein
MLKDGHIERDADGWTSVADHQTRATRELGGGAPIRAVHLDRSGRAFGSSRILCGFMDQYSETRDPKTIRRGGQGAPSVRRVRGGCRYTASVAAFVSVSGWHNQLRYVKLEQLARYRNQTIAANLASTDELLQTIAEYIQSLDRPCRTLGMFRHFEAHADALLAEAADDLVQEAMAR